LKRSFSTLTNQHGLALQLNTTMKTEHVLLGPLHAVPSQKKDPLAYRIHNHIATCQQKGATKRV
jgi:hypothetical protein